MSDFDLTQPALPNLIRLVLKFNMAASIKNNLMKGNIYMTVNYPTASVATILNREL
jgi:hypothetical protein